MARTRCYQGSISLRGRDVPYVFSRVPRRKHVHLVVGPDGELQVRCPWHCSRAEAHEFIIKHTDWVLDALDRHRSERRPPLVTGTELTFLDSTLRLRVDMDAQLSLLDRPDQAACADGQAVQAGKFGSGHVMRNGRNLRVRSGTLSQANIRSLLESWYRGQANRLLPARLYKFARKLGMMPHRVAVRGQRTRWGSCSSRGAISLNWRLLLLPTQLSDYVLVHELCHLRYLDHSPAYWRLVESIIPDYKALDKRLNTHQRSLPL